MSDTEHINALIKALLSMQERYLDSKAKWIWSGKRNALSFETNAHMK